MSNRRKSGQERRARSHSHGFDCGCQHAAVFEAEGRCDECGETSSMRFPPMPSSLPVGGIAELGWPCACGGEAVGLGPVVKVLRP